MLACYMISRRLSRLSLPEPNTAPLANPCKLRPFVFNQLQDAPLATLFVSKICIVAGGWVGGIFFEAAVSHTEFTPCLPLLFSMTYILPNLQALYFETVGTVGWGGRGSTRG